MAIRRRRRTRPPRAGGVKTNSAAACVLACPANKFAAIGCPHPSREKGSQLKQILFILFLCTFVCVSFAQPTGTAATDSQTELLRELSEEIHNLKQAVDTLGVQVARTETTSRKNLDKTENPIGTAVNLLEVCVAVLALILLVAGYLGITEARGWRRIRRAAERRASEVETKFADVTEHAKNVHKLREEVEEALKEVRECVSVIQGLREQAEKDAREFSARIKAPLPIPREKITSEVKEQFGEINRRLERVEAFGGKLRAEDYFNRGVDLNYKRKCKLALEAFAKAIEIDPNFAWAWLYKGSVLSDLGNIREAIKAFGTAIVKGIHIETVLVQGLFGRASMHSVLGERKEALVDLKRAIDIDKMFKRLAVKSIEFKDLWDDPEFKKLVE